MSLIQKTCLCATLAVSIVACTPTREAASPEAADLILSNAKIYTMNPQREWAQAVAIRNGRIDFVPARTERSLYITQAGKIVLHE